VIEGEDGKRADRNDLLGCLEIPSKSIKRDVPAGSDVEITIYMDESRLLTTKAYIPILDEEFEKVISFEKEKESIKELKENFEREKRRFNEARKKASSANSLKAQEAVAKIEDEDAIGNVQSLLDASEGDACAEPEFQNQLTDLKIAIDEIEDALEWPSLLAEIEEKLKWCKQIVDQYGDSTEKEKFRSLETEVQMAIDSGDPDLLRRYNEELQALGFEVLVRQPGFWVGMFQDLAKDISSMKDRNQAEQLISQGHNAMNRNDIEGLKAVVRQLIGLLPVDKQQQAMGGYGGTTVL
jgi:molecular chaperone DnaK